MNRDDFLKLYCNPAARVEAYRTPFIQGRYLIATEAHGFIALPEEEEDMIFYQYRDKPDCFYILNATIVPYQRIKLSELEETFNKLCTEFKKLDLTCPDCKGNGKVVYSYLSTDDNDYHLEAECPICHGAGTLEEKDYYYNEEFCLILDDKYMLTLPRIKNIIDAMKNFELNECDLMIEEHKSPVAVLHIKTNDFHLLVMPTKRPKEQ